MADKEQPAIKSIQERLKESIELLKKLRDLGVPDTDPSYKELSAKLSEWVKGGDAWQGHVDFQRFERRAYLVLPTKPGRIATCNLRHHIF
jgi:hypothetical protein